MCIIHLGNLVSGRRGMDSGGAQAAQNMETIMAKSRSEKGKDRQQLKASLKANDLWCLRKKNRTWTNPESLCTPSLSQSRN